MKIQCTAPDRTCPSCTRRDSGSESRYSPAESIARRRSKVLLLPAKSAAQAAVMRSCSETERRTFNFCQARVVSSPDLTQLHSKLDMLMERTILCLKVWIKVKSKHRSQCPCTSGMVCQACTEE
jgi:hypothetical protein